MTGFLQYMFQDPVGWVIRNKKISKPTKKVLLAVATAILGITSIILFAMTLNTEPAITRIGLSALAAIPTAIFTKMLVDMAYYRDRNQNPQNESEN